MNPPALDGTGVAPPDVPKRIACDYISELTHMSIHSLTRNEPSEALGQRSSESTNMNSPTDTLVAVAEQLRKVRNVAESSGDRMLLYFIDMTILHVCESICAVSGSGIADNLKQRSVEMAIHVETTSGTDSRR